MGTKVAGEDAATPSSRVIATGKVRSESAPTHRQGHITPHCKRADIDVQEGSAG